MNYTHNDKPNPRGEICLRGHNVFDGYHNLPDKTAEAIDEDGWLHTGDIGQFLPDGAIQIIDRKKNIFKLAQGEYVAAEELENTFKKSKYISQMWIYGNSFHTTLVAVIVPEHDTIMAWCQHNGVSGDFSEAVKDKKVYTLIENSIKEIAKTDKVAGFKVPKDLIIENDVNDDFQGFTVENDCLTPPFKLRRRQRHQGLRRAPARERARAGPGPVPGPFSPCRVCSLSLPWARLCPSCLASSQSPLASSSKTIAYTFFLK